MRVLLVPLARSGAGTGHVRRCLRLARELGDQAVLCFREPEELERWRADGAWPPGTAATRAPEEGAPWDLVIIDRKETTRSEYERYALLGPVAALDEAGEARRLACYVLDIIPGTARSKGRGAATPANREAPELMDLPAPGRRETGGPARSILVTFGGEDPAHLTEAFLRVALRVGLRERNDITIVQGGRFERTIHADGMRVVVSPPSLAPLYAGADVVVTAYGLSCFEAMAAGVPVMLLHPTSLHERLARLAGLPSLGRLAPRRGRVRAFLARPESIRPPVARFQALLAGAGADERGSPGLARAVAAVAASLGSLGAAAGACPLCGNGRSVRHRAVRRVPARTHYRCSRTGLLYAVPIVERVRRYDARYFAEEYRSQYGKTYLEDFDSILASSRMRVRFLGDLVHPPATVLDVGCAYGPFLVACREAGFEPLGLDISREAVAHVTDVLGIRARCADFGSVDVDTLRSEAPSCLTMWYVVEHFPDLGRILRRVNALLPLGGAFAFSTPNGAGVSARAGFGPFLDRSPMDHYTVWSPGCARSVLGLYGFRVTRVRVTGHHPERSRLLSAAPGGGGRAVSVLLGLGDTFEVYATKTRDVADGEGADGH